MNKKLILSCLMMMLFVIGSMLSCSDDDGKDCITGDSRCSGTVLQKCVDGYWKTYEDCADQNMVCEKGDDEYECFDIPAGDSSVPAVVDAGPMADAKY